MGEKTDGFGGMCSFTLNSFRSCRQPVSTSPTKSYLKSQIQSTPSAPPWRLGNHQAAHPVHGKTTAATHDRVG
ncbi:hypothetical protein Naga_100778g1 [Nannochloropsis gaditana]|uniref:Uncharacterized protein n=1 Tax=Nannochloropsis gaditana TaxID=72520 RepID=W7TB72_9STRA|nr:hypothetical protein Naga_100778g1 [Nannochloropsis gaditana]